MFKPIAADTVTALFNASRETLELVQVVDATGVFELCFIDDAVANVTRATVVHYFNGQNDILRSLDEVRRVENISLSYVSEDGVDYETYGFAPTHVLQAFYSLISRH